jgi:hypothetical protein
MVKDMNSLSGLFVPEQEADPDTVMKDLEKYLELLNNIPCLLTEAAGTHTPGHVKCAACVMQEKDIEGPGNGQAAQRAQGKSGGEQYLPQVRQV